MGVAIYILDKSGKSSVPLNTLLLLLLTGFLLHPVLSIPWIWSPSDPALRVWRASLLLSVVVLSVAYFGIWTWPGQPTDKALLNPSASSIASPAPAVRKIQW